MDTALVLFETTEDFRRELTKILGGYKIVYNENNGTAAIDAQTAADTTIIFGNAKPDFLKLCPRLKWVQLGSAGANDFVNGELNGSVKLTCASGCYGHAVSEHMLALTVDLMKKLYLYRDGQPAGSWQSRGSVKSIQGAVVCVIGIGDIGSNYSKRMKALGAYIIGLDINNYAKPDFLDEFFLLDKLDDVLKRADVVALGVPGTKNTKGLIGKHQLAQMKKDAILINACRGFIVDTEALCDALESKSIGAAGLDVTEPEPLPPEHRLWKQENVIITPHIAGGRHLKQTGEYILQLCLRNAGNFLNNKPLESLVDFQTGFRVPVFPVI